MRLNEQDFQKHEFKRIFGDIARIKHKNTIIIWGMIKKIGIKLFQYVLFVIGI